MYSKLTDQTDKTLHVIDDSSAIFKFKYGRPSLLIYTATSIGIIIIIMQSTEWFPLPEVNVDEDKPWWKDSEFRTSKPRRTSQYHKY